jgi:hypothetical protein
MILGSEGPTPTVTIIHSRGADTIFCTTPKFELKKAERFLTINMTLKLNLTVYKFSTFFNLNCRGKNSIYMHLWSV